jgi:hypothetical protein
MPQYSRTELLAAFRQDNPDLSKIPDNELFAAIAQDSPELAQGISELHQPPVKEQGFLGGLKRGVNSLTEMVKHPIDTASGIVSEGLAHATPQRATATMLERAKSAMARARGDKHSGEGLDPYLHGAVAAVPLIGQHANDLLMQAGEGDLAGAMGEATVDVLGGEAAGGVLKSVPGVARAGLNKITSADKLMELAGRAREAKGLPLNPAPVSGRGAIMTGVKAGANVAKKVAAPVLEKTAEFMSRNDKAPTFAGQPPAQVGEPIPFEGAPLVDEFQLDVKPPAGPPQNIPFEGPPLVDDFALETKPPAGPAQNIPFEGAPLVDEFQLDVKPPAGPSADIPFKGEPVTPNGPTMPPTSGEIQMLERAIAPAGNAKKLMTLRNAPELLKEAPELRNVPPGAAFDTRLMKAFEAREAMVDAAEASVPRTTVVPKKPIVDQITAMQAEYAMQNMNQAVTALNKIKSAWEAMPDNIPWEQFRNAKRSFFKEARSTSGPMRRAYGVLMDAASKVSPELSKVNKSYSIVRRAIENANIDLTTGRRIGQVGKLEAAPVKQTAPKPLNRLNY